MKSTKKSWTRFQLFLALPRGPGRVGNKPYHIGDLALEDIAKVIQRIQGYAVILPQRVQRACTDAVLLNQRILADLFSLHGRPKRLKGYHITTSL